jgi:transaldolase / glucose-6-phosphate isomerase
VNPLRELGPLGQSVWLDFISRGSLKRGELQRLVDDDGVSGVTSNPTIFQKAMAAGTDYDDQLRRVIASTPDITTAALFEAAALDDIRAAAAVLKPVFDRTDGADGFVSFEVSPTLANDTAGTVSEARRLWKALAQPNVMIKVPATPAGIPAIEELIADGININVTLMFSMEHYVAVAQAYIHGLERCARPARVASVASFFVSRVDSMVDKALEQIGTPEALALRGRAAIANSQAVYQRFREIFYGAPFAALRARGCRVQRPLWASTSAKNPSYRDVIYVEELIGPDTVNTMPPETVSAFRDHGVARTTVDENPGAAREALGRLQAVGVDLGAVTARLQVDGVASFAKSYEDLMGALEQKRKALQCAKLDAQSFALGAMAPVAVEAWARSRDEKLSARIWAKDHTAWCPTVVPELVNRLGWLALPHEMAAQAGEMAAFADEVRAEGIRHVVLLGMGGSSLAPEVFQATFGPREGFPVLTVLDSTHPDAVAAVERQLDLARTLFVVSSKSGGTSETTSFFRYFWSKYPVAEAGRHFIAITDPRTSLEALARERGFRRVFNAQPEVGGRYSALTAFGLVPAALVGVDVAHLLEHARAMSSASGPAAEGEANPSVALGVALAELALAGRDKVTFLVSPSVTLLPAWIEQLVAESTGKNGKGILPVADEPAIADAGYGDDRVFVTIGVKGEDESSLSAAGQRLAALGHPVVSMTLGKKIDLGQEFFRWELATAAAGAVLGIQPFDQPDVQLAKDLARRAMEAAGGEAPGASSAVADRATWRGVVAQWLSSAAPHDYLGIQAYLAPSAAAVDALQRLRKRLGARAGVATTLGLGPRFLHSTGQLHKGGPNNGLFLQLVDAPQADLPVPETTYTFGQLIRAQAAGDAMALEQRGRRVVRLDLGSEPLKALEELIGMV